jgi:hypothetical protein
VRRISYLEEQRWIVEHVQQNGHSTLLRVEFVRHIRMLQNTMRPDEFLPEGWGNASSRQLLQWTEDSNVTGQYYPEGPHGFSDEQVGFATKVWTRLPDWPQLPVAPALDGVVFLDDDDSNVEEIEEPL